MHSSKRFVLLAALPALLVGAAPRTAHASPSFPGEIEAELGLDATPACTLCHVGTPGLGSASTPFAVAMRSRNLVAGNADSLKTALSALDGAQSDVDGDGTPDIDELKAGTDPNGSGGAAGDETVAPEYGCNNISGAPPEAGGLLLVLLSLVFARRASRARIAR